uniref:GOLD domain-containing protein n=1 Tax=Nelumbo nucifera TaxID=4432 RepID=A0A822Z4T2_NELNU|nr:TPA_asm: hypothetical protein HUJ06_013943 [Nelumbo nucifera]
MALRIPAMLLIVSWMGVLHLGEALWLNVPPSKAKCLSEEIKGNVNVLGKYNVISNDPDHSNTIDAKVISPRGNVVYNVKNVTHGQFSFTTTEPGNYLTCFWMDGYNRDVETTVNLDWRKGLAARDWGYVAKIENLEVCTLKCVFYINFFLPKIYSPILYFGGGDI